jgi:hypothetical protein
LVLVLEGGSSLILTSESKLSLDEVSAIDYCGSKWYYYYNNYLCVRGAKHGIKKRKSAWRRGGKKTLVWKLSNGPSVIALKLFNM